MVIRIVRTGGGDMGAAGSRGGHSAPRTGTHPQSRLRVAVGHSPYIKAVNDFYDPSA